MSFFFAVLLTPTETQRSNIRRLEYVLWRALPMKVTYDNTTLITKIQGQLVKTLATGERVRLLRELGHCYRVMGKLDDARQALEESLSLDPQNYQAIKELLPLLAHLRDVCRAKEVMALLLRLDPHNPTVFNDCFLFAAGLIERTELLKLVDCNN
jgi:lipoprotein NlpI